MKLRVENAQMTAAEKKEICDGTILDSYKLKFDGIKKMQLESHDQNYRQELIRGIVADAIHLRSAGPGSVGFSL